MPDENDTLELSTLNTPAQTRKKLSVGMTLPAGDKLKLELGVKELDVTVPEGEVWSASVQININVADT